MAKICDNCACYEVCIYANPNRTEDCTLWKPETKWIPVSERLPEDDLPKDSKVKQIKVFVAYKTNGRWITRTQIRKKGHWYGAPDEWDWIKTSDPITHWMPLPEPPKEEV